ncbi:hypothetical protein V6O07_04060, partial [Arthrospira platensis SPKY2]
CALPILLDRMKHSKSFAYNIRLDAKGENLLENSDTGNRQNIYNYKDEDIHFYGVYGELVYGQIDSRKNTDEEILAAIEKMLSIGNLADRN